MTKLTNNQSLILQYILDHNNEVYNNYKKEELINNLKDWYGSNLSDYQFNEFKEFLDISKEQENIINNAIKDQKELNPYKIENKNRLNKLKQSFIKSRQKLKKTSKIKKSIKFVTNTSSDSVIIKNIGRGRKKKNTKKRRKKHKKKN